jgi:hypothetical protein
MVGLEERDVLDPLALAVHQIAARLKARRLELTDDVIGRLLLRWSVDAATLVGVRTEGPHVL